MNKFLPTGVFCCFFCYLCAQIDSSDTGHWAQAHVYKNPVLPLAAPQQIYRLYFDDLNSQPDSIWAELGKCSNLKQLSLEGDFFATMPPELLAIAADLEDLAIVANSRVNWGDFWDKIPRFKRLKSLSLTYCDFGANLPKGFSRLNKTKVKNLDLSNSQFKANFSTDFSAMKRIETLNLSSCGLDSLPPKFHKLKKLQHLDLGIHPEGSPNLLSELPADFYKLRQLQTLSLAENPIKKLPDNFAQLRQLQNINLADCSQLNPAHTLRQLTTMNNLVEINLANVPLRVLSGEVKNWGNLRHLDISGCQLNNLPPALFKLSSIETINWDGNSFAPDELLRYQNTLKQR